MVIGVTSFQIHLPESRSLKDKRQVLRRVKDRLRAHHNVAVLEEEEHASLWQRAEVVVVSAGSRDAWSASSTPCAGRWRRTCPAT